MIWGEPTYFWKHPCWEFSPGTNASRVQSIQRVTWNCKAELGGCVWLMQWYSMVYLAGGFKYFWNFHPDPWGRWTHFDEHIFQRGWNHQLVYSFVDSMWLGDTLLGTNISPEKSIFEDYFPFPKVGYVCSLKSISWLCLGGQSKIERILYQIYIVGNL